MPVIYKISCPITGDVKYIGQTNSTLNKRLNSHRSMKYTPIYDWIKSLPDGASPNIELIQKVTSKDVCGIEYKWIRHYSDLGCLLLNKIGVKNTCRLPVGYGKYSQTALRQFVTNKLKSINQINQPT